MRQQATDRSQSTRLIACGVDTSSADMMWKEDMVSIRLEVLTHPWIENLRNLHYSPAWSLSALLALLPKDLTWQGLYYRLVMGPYKDKWEIEYNDLSVLNNAHSVRANCAIEACVQMIEWLTGSGYELNKIEQ